MDTPCKKLRNLKKQNNIPPTPFKGGVRPGISIIFWITIFNLVTQWGYIFAQESKVPVMVGAERTYTYFKDLEGKRIGVVANQNLTN